MRVRGLLPLLLLLALLPTGRATAATGIPTGWPHTLQLGARDEEYGAATLKDRVRLGLRYHYLSGGAERGKGWQTWADGGGSFVPKFIDDSVQHGFLPAFSLYQLRETGPGASMEEEKGILSNLGDRPTMRTYFEDVRVFMQKAGETGQRTVLHVEPDIWGYIQRNSPGGDPGNFRAEVASTGLPELADLSDDATGFARAFARLRDRYAPKVTLGYHLSVWGTGEDPAYSDPSDARIDELAASSATFFRRLGTDFDLVFAEFSDRDAGFREKVDGDGGASRWDDGDFDRQARYLAGMASRTGRRIVLWQIPLGNSRQNDTPFHYRDNRVEKLLATGAEGEALRRRYVKAGVIAMLFGNAVPQNTGFRDEDGDGKVDDGDVFVRLANSYLRRPIALPGATRKPARSRRARSKAPRTRITTTASRSGRRVTVRVRATSASAARVVLAVQLYEPGAGSRPTLQKDYRGQRLRGGVAKTYTARFTLPNRPAGGRWRVKVGIFDAGFEKLLVWRPNAAAFKVR